MSSASSGRVARGFTLVELAVVMLVIALILGSVVLPLATGVANRRYDETQRILDQAREALIGYAAANGRFPCPASCTSSPCPTVANSYGAEHFASFPSPPGTAANGSCNALVTGAAGVYSGFLPAVTLGFTPIDANGYAVDAWGLAQNRIRYAVSSQAINGQANAFTKTNGMRNATMAYLTKPENPLGTTVYLLQVCNTASASSTDCTNAAAKLALNVPVVIWSLGPNAATGGTSPDEVENLDNDRIFVSRTKAAVEEVSGEFDDIVTWIGTSTLFSRLIAAGQLP